VSGEIVDSFNRGLERDFVICKLFSWVVPNGKHLYIERNLWVH